MDRIYKYNSDASYKPNGGIYLQLITAKDLYIQNITVAEHDGHSDSFQVKFPNVFTNYPLGAVRVEDQRFKDWDHYKFTIWQSQLNFVVFCASSACGVSVEHLNAKEPMIRSIYRFHVYYHIRRILKIPEIPLPYENSFNQYNNPYNHEKFIGICSEYGVSKAWFPFGHFLPFVARFGFSYQQKATTSNAMLKWKHPQKTKTSNKKP